ncbi:MAG: hypothetical protein QM791_13845 [Ferruginibacter sp.]
MFYRGLILFAFVVTSFLFFSCQRELNFPVLPSDGFLSNSAGDCLPKTIAGTYTAGKNLADSNFIQAQVHVTQAGDYTIVSDTVNGFSFRASGSFADTGLVFVKLTGRGTPAAEDTSSFTIRYGNSHCVMDVIVASANPEATFTLFGAPATCNPASVGGSYITGVPLGSNDSAIITVQVTQPGTYTIFTNEVNGYKFSSSGTLAAGKQTIVLKSIGAPVSAGTDRFTITAGGSSCTFDVAVSSPIIVAGTDYFPLTLNSYWTYHDQLHPTDTIKRIITGDTTVNSLAYRVMHEYDKYGGDTTLLFRRTGTDYLQYGRADILTVALSYVPRVMGQINFLKQPLVNGDTWLSEEYLGNLFSGQPIYLQYYFTCLESNTGITVNGNSFINVYHILLMPQIRANTVNPFVSTNELIHLYYAKGVGLVYIKGTDNAGFSKIDLGLKYWMVY